MNIPEVWFLMLYRRGSIMILEMISINDQAWSPYQQMIAI